MPPDIQPAWVLITSLIALVSSIFVVIGGALTIRRQIREVGDQKHKDAAESIAAEGGAAVSLSNAAATLVKEIQANAAQQIEELQAQLDRCYERIEALEAKEEEHKAKEEEHGAEIAKLKARLIESEAINLRLEEENAALRVEMRTMQEKVEKLRVVNATLLAQNGDLKQRLKDAGLWQAENGKP